ncbi:dTDP-4-dehydrorhamnose 3,5-epimerase [Gracilimonas mengyeensis]|uniref:dTDP-4-dehydrorhamnose 3,5-epimerase n=1 Tax=Gracilimonas mengyeensis TaxID=1302730 RepID=A0A521EPG2_9BACT|nr:dTDP-4-dehydrorhamnose 3,5-epimerase [Gracilimonas mengyeensis]SMO85819.1 dTDP-4-dehydrorhamnose 3,5-epimerase [Gracilimonas mengyeensis]
MKVKETRIADVKLIEPRVFEDDRGYFFEAYRESVLADAGITAEFVQDNVSKSYKNTIRGLHYQIEKPQAKLVQCLSGTILDVAVDIRQNSPSFGQYVAYKLSDENKHQLYIPVGFAHGFSVLSDEAVVSYKCSDYYHKPGERGIRWDDPKIRVNWDVERPLLSDKDRTQPLFSSINKEDLF